MHVGREGMKSKELVELVCSLRLADWEVTKSKQATVSGIISKEPRFVRVSHYKYTLRCFPGVVEFKREPSGWPPAAATHAPTRPPARPRALCLNSGYKFSKVVNLPLCSRVFMSKRHRW